MFPGHVSTLAVTDPELIDIFDNFTFDEVRRHDNLDIRMRLMVQLASIIASQAVREYRAMLGAALTVGVTPVEPKEILYQAVPYVGIRRPSTSSRPPMNFLPSEASDYLYPAGPRGRRKTARRRVWRFRKRSSVAMPWRNFIPRLPQTSSTSIAISLPTASVIITLARASTCPHASCSHLQHACRARRMRIAGQGPCSGEPPCRQ
jgi:alkylhydroperoxidase/carboxymuconolactone decarboxylase family protein YurZ